MLSCADAEQMELCPDEMKRKKQAFLNQNPCTKVFHILKEKKREERESKPCKLRRKEVLESDNVLLDIGLTVLNCTIDNWRSWESGFAKYQVLALSPLFLGFVLLLFDSYLAAIPLILFPRKGQILWAFIGPEVTGTFLGECQVQNQLKNYNQYFTEWLS